MADQPLQPRGEQSPKHIDFDELVKREPALQAINRDQRRALERVL